MSETEVTDPVSYNVADRDEFERSWADLPDLLLFKIFSLISLDSRAIMFTLVCKSWNSILQSPTPTKQPFQLNNHSPNLFFANNKIIHPILDKVYEFNKIPEKILGLQLRTAKDDWLLFTQEGCFDYTSRDYTPPKAIFFNPFTRATVWIPVLLGSVMSMCFTLPPTSADVKVVVVRKLPVVSGQWEKITIDTIKREDRWTSYEFEFRGDSLFETSYCNPVLYKGMCYVLDKYSTLLIHNPKKKTFFIHDAPEFLSGNTREQYMLESNGKLLAVFVETSGNWVLVCRWNVSERIWEKLESLGNNSLFVNRPYSISETVSERGMENRVYLPRLMGDRCLFYSLDTKRFHTCDGSSYTSFHGSKTAFSSTWIKPSYETLS